MKYYRKSRSADIDYCVLHWISSLNGFLSLLDSWNGNFEFDYEEENNYDTEEDDDDA